MAYGVAIGLIISIVIVSAVLISVGLYYNNKLNNCQSQESPYCMMITCPDDPAESVCGGYAKRDAGDGYVYCSNAPTTKVKTE